MRSLWQQHFCNRVDRLSADFFFFFLKPPIMWHLHHPSIHVWSCTQTRPAANQSCLPDAITHRRNGVQCVWDGERDLRRFKVYVSLRQGANHSDFSFLDQFQTDMMRQCMPQTHTQHSLTVTHSPTVYCVLCFAPCVKFHCHYIHMGIHAKVLVPAMETVAKGDDGYGRLYDRRRHELRNMTTDSKKEIKMCISKKDVCVSNLLFH